MAIDATKATARACDACGTVAKAAATVCEKCGATLKEMPQTEMLNMGTRKTDEATEAWRFESTDATIGEAGEGVYYGRLLKPFVKDQQDDIAAPAIIRKAILGLNAREHVPIDIDHETAPIADSRFMGAFECPEDMTIAGKKFNKGDLVIKYSAPPEVAAWKGHSLVANAKVLKAKAADGSTVNVCTAADIVGFTLVKNELPAVDGPVADASKATAEEIAKMENQDALQEIIAKLEAAVAAEQDPAKREALQQMLDGAKKLLVSNAPAAAADGEPKPDDVPAEAPVEEAKAVTTESLPNATADAEAKKPHDEAPADGCPKCKAKGDAVCKTCGRIVEKFFDVQPSKVRSTDWLATCPKCKTASMACAGCGYEVKDQWGNPHPVLEADPSIAPTLRTEGKVAPHQPLAVIAAEAPAKCPKCGGEMLPAGTEKVCCKTCGYEDKAWPGGMKAPIAATAEEVAREQAACRARSKTCKAIFRVKRQAAAETTAKDVPMPAEGAAPPADAPAVDLEETADGLALVYWTRPGEYPDVKDYDVEGYDGLRILMATVDGELAVVGYRFSKEHWTPESAGAYLFENVIGPPVATEAAPMERAAAGSVAAPEPFAERAMAAAARSAGEYEIVKGEDGAEFVKGIITYAESSVRADDGTEVTPEAIVDLVARKVCQDADVVADHEDEEGDKKYPFRKTTDKIGQLYGEHWTKWGVNADGQRVLKAQAELRITDPKYVAKHKNNKLADLKNFYRFSHDSDQSGVKVQKVAGGPITKRVMRFDRNHNIAMVNRQAHLGCTWEERQAASLKSVPAATTAPSPKEIAMDQETENALRGQALRLAEVTGSVQGFSERDMASVRAFIAKAPIEKIGSKLGDLTTDEMRYVIGEMTAIRVKNAATIVPPAGTVATTDVPAPIGVVPGTFTDVRDKAAAMFGNYFGASDSPKKVKYATMEDAVSTYLHTVDSKTYSKKRVKAADKFAVLGAAGVYLDEFHSRSDFFSDDFIEDVTERRKAAYDAARVKLQNDTVGKFDDERQKATVLTTGIDQACADAVGKIMHPGYEQTEVDDDGMFSIPMDELCEYEAVDNFYTQKIINVSEFELPLSVTEGSPYLELQAMTDYQETYSVALYGGILTVSEQAEANSSVIKVIDQVPDKMFRAMARRRRRLVTEVIRLNTATAGGAGNLLFSSGNGNANANAYTFDQFIALLVSYCTIRAFSHGANTQDQEHLRNKPTFVLASVTQLFNMLRDLSLDTNPASTNRSANQALMAFGNLKMYACNDWDTAGTTGRVMVGGSKKLFRLADYKGIKTPQIFINNDPRFGVTFSSPVKQFAVKWGGGVGIQDPRFAAAHTA